MSLPGIQPETVSTFVAFEIKPIASKKNWILGCFTNMFVQKVKNRSANSFQGQSLVSCLLEA